MPRYEVIGRPAGSSLLANLAVGSYIDADLNAEQEAALIGEGALRRTDGFRAGTDARARDGT